MYALSAEFTFGFVPDTYSIDEAEMQVVFNVSLISDILNRDVVIRFYTENGTALCKIYTVISSHGDMSIT